MADIEFTQYMRPNGRQVPVRIDRPEPIAARAQEIIAAGFRFECEELTTGEVSLTIFDPKEETDVAIQVCRNGPDVPLAVDRLVNGFAVTVQP